MSQTSPVSTASARIENTIWLKQLRITNFRPHLQLSLSLPCLAPIVLTGANGAGKTSLLEAISLLGPGRGLRMASADQIMRKESKDIVWGVSAQLATQNLQHQISLACKLDGSTFLKQFRLNGRKLSSIELSRTLNCFWLTPAMARLFSEGSRASDRRRFFDRMVMGLVPEHAQHLAAFDRAKRARQTVLDNTQKSDEWLLALEAQMAQSGVRVGLARAQCVLQLNLHIADLKPSAFPDGQVGLFGAFESDFLNGHEDENIAHYRKSLAANRKRDQAAQRTLIGPHQADLSLIDRATGLSAQNCSSGEVKALLTALVLASARLSQKEKNAVPIILLDEIAAHLDEARRFALFNLIAHWDVQIWMTGTDRALFAPMKMVAHFFHITQGNAEPG